MMRYGPATFSLLILAALLITPSAIAGPSPFLKSYKAEYRVSRGKFIIGIAEISLQIGPNGQYQYTGHTKPVGLVAVFRKDEISEASEGVIANQRITPITYRYTHKKKKKTRQVDLKFDWASQQVTNRAQGSRWKMKIPDNTQDKFSQQLALMLNLNQGKSNSTFKVADGGLLKQYQFDVVKKTILKTEAGEFETLKLARKKDNRPSKASFWMAPELNYVPVKIMKKEDDGEFIMELKKFSWL